LAEIVCSYADLSSVRVTEETAFANLPIDSQDMLRVFSRIQAIYKIKLDAKDVLGATTMGALLAAVRRHTESS
jgi:acyl carrier protein